MRLLGRELDYLPTRQAAWLVLAGSPLFVLGLFSPQFIVAGLLYDALVVIVFVADVGFLLRYPRVELKRRHSAVLSLAVKNFVEIDVLNPGARNLTARLKDDPPHNFSTNDRDQLLRVPAHAMVTMSYDTTPTSRGEFEFGIVAYRLSGPLGLALRQGRAEQPAPVKVYPNITGLAKTQLEVARASLPESGLRKTRHVGEGQEFERLRTYVKGDDYRRIDWKATAKARSLMVREYETERSQRVMVLLDCGRLMTNRIGRYTKLDYAVNATLHLAHAALENGDQVGLLVFGDRVKTFIPPRKGRPQLLGVTDALYRVEAELRESDYAAAYAFTDLVDVEASKILLSRLLKLPPRHLPLCVTISDSNLLEAARRVPATSDQLYERIVSREILLEYQKAIGLLDQAGALTVNVPAASLSVATVNAYLRVKTRGML